MQNMQNIRTLQFEIVSIIEELAIKDQKLLEFYCQIFLIIDFNFYIYSNLKFSKKNT